MVNIFFFRYFSLTILFRTNIIQWKGEVFLKKIIFVLVVVCLIVGGFLIFRKEEKNEGLEKVKVAEVTHSVFYAPQYVADALGYFKDEGLDVEIILASGADKVTSAVLSGDVQIGFCGSESTIYVYNQKQKDYLINFAGLTKKDGSFLVGRSKSQNFDLNELKGKHIIGGREGGMPAMTLEYALNRNGIKSNEVNIDTSIDFASMSGAFMSGTGDYVALFEPTASELENEGYGYIVASIGELGGNVPYTTYNAKKSYIEDNPKVIEGFTKAIQKGLDFVHTHSSKEVAEVIESYFPDTKIDDLINIVQRYMDIDSWYDTTYISKKDFEHIEEIVDNPGKLEAKAPYKKLVDNSYAER